MTRTLDAVIATLAVERGWISPARVREFLATRTEGSDSPTAGLVWVESGLLRPDQVRDLLAEHAVALGALDVRIPNFVSAWQEACRLRESGSADLPGILAGLREGAQGVESADPRPHPSESPSFPTSPTALVTHHTPAVRGSDPNSGPAASRYDAGHGPGAKPPGDAVTLRDGNRGPAAWMGEPATVRDPAFGPAEPPESTATVRDPARGSADTMRVAGSPPAAPGDTVLDDGFAPATPPAGPSEGALPLPLGRRIGKYQLYAEVGRGGMGIVYRAVDVDLKREVALKTLHAADHADREAVDRLLREARTAATLQHPAIVPIYDVGVMEGTPYFAMAFVRGATLDSALGRGRFPTLRERVQILHDLAEAIAFAHSRGVIHRDLKPANVLLEDGGGLKVMDFGLARRTGETKLTVTGQVMGTPGYMPPEQIRGQIHLFGPPVDVYALGVMLYELMTERLPFEGETAAEVMAKALRDDPVAPRKRAPRVPPDLETICLKAMHKEPAARYPTARELTDDLARFLRGEAILARRETWSERAVRWVRRRPALAGAAALALIGFGVAGAMAARAEQSARDSARAEQERLALARKVMVELRERAGLYHDAALELRRAGAPVRTAEKYLGLLRSGVEEAERLDPATGEPRYHLGRLLRALDRFAEADAEQACALDRQPDLLAARYERAVLASARLAERVDELRTAWSREEGLRLTRLGALQSAELAAAHARARPADAQLIESDPAGRQILAALLGELDVLEQSLDTAGASPGGSPLAGPVLTPAMVDCARGLVAMHSGEPDGKARARDLLEGALRADDRLEEAYAALAQLDLAEGNPEAASSVFVRATEVDRGHAVFWRRLAEVCSLLGGREEAAGRDPRPQWDQGVSAATRSLELRPDDAHALRLRGQLHGRAGLWEHYHGGDPTPRYRDACRDLDAAVAARPDDRLARIDRAILRENQGLYIHECHQDPIPVWESALADSEHLIRLDPDFSEGWRLRASIRTNIGKRKERHGGDGTTTLSAALEDYDRALAISPHDSLIWLGRGEARGTLGVFVGRRHRDPGPDYAAAAADLAEALRLEPKSIEIRIRRGELETNRAVRAARSGGNPLPHLEAALADLEEAKTQNATYRDTAISLGRLLGNWGEIEMERGVDPDPRLTDALREIDAALALRPNDVDAWSERGKILRRRALWRERHREEIGPLLEQAIAAAERILETDPADPRGWVLRGTSLSQQAGDALRRGRDPGAVLDRAVADLRRAAEIGGEEEAHWRSLGISLRFQGERRAARGEDPEPVWAEAEAAFERGMRAAPDAVGCVEQRGRLRCVRADRAARLGGQAMPWLDAAIADFTRVVESPAAGATAWRARGQAHLLRAAHLGPRPEGAAATAAALADLTRALELAPGDPESFELRAVTHQNHGVARTHRGEDGLASFAAAAADFGAAAAGRPKDAGIHKSHGAALAQTAFLSLERGRRVDAELAAAEAAFTRALELGGPDWECHWRRGIVRLVREDADGAVVDLEAAGSLAPEQGELWREALEAARAAQGR